MLAQPFHALDVEQVCLDLDRHAVLRNVTLSIKSGEHLAIIGASGSGKSSLLKLIANFYQPDQGHILWNQQEVKDYTQNSFRGQLAYVEQEACLFHGTLAENIACTPDIDINRMQQALENANLSDWVAQLPLGIQSMIGPQSSNISGGQKQRIAIARALYKSASLLLLDEITSALDPKNTHEILSKVSQIANTTMIMITHHACDLAYVDRVLVLSDGKVVAEGSPAEIKQSVHWPDSMGHS